MASKTDVYSMYMPELLVALWVEADYLKFVAYIAADCSVKGQTRPVACRIQRLLWFARKKHSSEKPLECFFMLRCMAICVTAVCVCV